jgi:hypothetical protein
MARGAVFQTLKDYDPAGGAAGRAAAKRSMGDAGSQSRLENGLTFVGLDFQVIREKMNQGHG